MEFKKLTCPIPRRPRRYESLAEDHICGTYLCDMDAVSSTSIRFTCRNPHAEGHSQRVEFIQDGQGNTSYREIPEDTEKKSYAHDSGIRFPALAEEVAG